MGVATVAMQYMKDHKLSSLWYGMPEQIHDIAKISGVKKGHPINVIATVISCIARSEHFKRSGYINHLGRNYPVYELTNDGCGAV